MTPLTIFLIILFLCNTRKIFWKTGEWRLTLTLQVKVKVKLHFPVLQKTFFVLHKNKMIENIVNWVAGHFLCTYKCLTLYDSYRLYNVRLQNNVLCHPKTRKNRQGKVDREKRCQIWRRYFFKWIRLRCKNTSFYRVLPIQRNPSYNPIDTGRILNILCTFNLRPVSTGRVLLLLLIWTIKQFSDYKS